MGRGDITIKVTETGTLEPVSQVDVKSRVAGRLQHIFVREGQRIQAGDPIAIVDPTEVTRQVEGVKAQLAASQAGLAQAEETTGSPFSKTVSRSLGRPLPCVKPKRDTKTPKSD